MKEYIKTEADINIIETWKTEQSILKTAKLTGESRVRVRKVLITENLWGNETSDKIKKLLETGKSTEEISEILNLSIKTVQSLTPYTRRKYDESPNTKDAVKSKNYRKRMRLAERNQKRKSRERAENMKGRDSVLRVNLTQANAVAFFESLGGMEGISDAFLDGLSFVCDDSCLDAPPVNTAYKVRLTLKTDAGPLSVIRLYGKCKKDISRDVIVPGGMPLCELHYLIQRAFGWQDSGSHRFCLSPDVLGRITDSSAEGFINLAGEFFDFAAPGTLPFREERVYDSSCSIRSWLRNQYRPPYDRVDRDTVKKAAREAALSFSRYEFPHTAEDLMKKKLVKSDRLSEVSVSELRGYIPYVGDLIEAASINDVFAHTDSFRYNYDMKKDNWEVEIRLLFSAEAPGTVVPLCTRTDGLAVMERIGGPAGYASFLKDISFVHPSQINWVEILSGEGFSPHSKEGKLAIALDKGWSPRRYSAKNTI